MRVLITGGAGHIGSHLTERLVKEGYEVTVIDNLSTGKEEYLTGVDCEFAKGDISQGIPVRDYDYIFHFAAFAGVRDGETRRRTVNQANVVGTRKVVELAKEVDAKIIFAGSSSTFGDPLYLPIDEEHPQNPKSVYAKSKLVAEQQIIDSGVDYAILRFFNVFGGRMRPNTVIPIFIERAKRGEDLVCNGNPLRDFTYVGDCIEATIKAMDVNGIFNIGTGRSHSIKWLAEKIVEKYDSDSRIIDQGRLGIDPTITLSNSHKARKELGWKPKTTLEEWLKWLDKEWEI